MLASKNRHRPANFAHGFLLHEGKSVKKNIEGAIHYYKEASSFNIPYAKNNLGIIYKHGYDKQEGKASNAIVYFEEAILQKKDILSMYNLALIYIFDDNYKDIDKAINLLIRSSQDFKNSFILLCLVLAKQGIFDTKKIFDLFKLNKIEDNNLVLIIIQCLDKLQSYGNLVICSNFESYREKDFLYNIFLKPVLTSELDKIKINDDKLKYPYKKDISNEFFEGFGRDLLD
ncbi:hypothetical protein M9Y10_006839 [Tritrichomonas musculus]|uniref:Uncharacterized protein n=1 Tax=Tritrichomonas musculus TaxID=1915356 RepID=A0ABR2JFP7_9EUKA